MSEVPYIRPALLTPDQNVIDELEVLLAAAKAGKLRGFLHFSLLIDNNVQWGFIGDEMKSSYLRIHGMLGWMQKRALERWEDRSQQIAPEKQT